MKRNKILTGIFALVAIMSILSVSAWAGGYTSLNLVEKNPLDWTIVDGGHSGKLTISQSLGVEWTSCYGDSISCKGYVIKNFMTFYSNNLEPETNYTLIYYGDATHNDEWNYATCIDEGTSSASGKLYTPGIYKTSYPNGNILKDEIAQKFWLVESSDVDCNAGGMTAWNPTNYLFETRTI